MSSKWVTINFELVHLINRTCNFRTEVYTEPCETSKMELFVKRVNGFKVFIIFTRSWIRLCRSIHLRGVLENRCSEICSQNPRKIPMKKFIFSKVAGWQSHSLRCLPNKQICENCVFRRFRSEVKTSGNEIVQLY